MKTIPYVILLYFLGLTFYVSAQSNLNVHLVYDNSSLSPIRNTIVQLKLGGVVIDTATTDTAGNCIFPNLAAGTYLCIPVCTKPWGGINSTDAFLVMFNFTGNILTGLHLAAAEVNGTGFNPNALDALLIVHLFVGLSPPDFQGVPRWKYETINISVSGSGTIFQQIKMICSGDVNGSYIPQ